MVCFLLPRTHAFSFVQCGIDIVVIIIIPGQLAILWDYDYAECSKNFVYELILKKKKKKQKQKAKPAHHLILNVK